MIPAVLAGLALFAIAFWNLAPRDGKTTMTRLIDLMFAYSLWCWHIAEAMDAGYRQFRLRRAEVQRG